jgi:hypothetical protein
MDPVRNPFAPGAGTPPPELAGRADILRDIDIALQRLAIQRQIQSSILVGLRGVGKTVLLVRMKAMAEERSFKTLMIEAHDGKTLPELLVPGLQSALHSLSLVEGAKEAARKSLRVLKSFLTGLKIDIGGVAMSIDGQPGAADSGDLESDLPNLLLSIGEAARAANSPFALLIDELQYLSEKEFSSLIMSVHKITQSNLPIILIGAGLPQILGLAGESKSYAERLFKFPKIGELTEQDARTAIVKPIRDEDACIEDGAVMQILKASERYPYFIQQWAHDSWNAAAGSTITQDDVLRATITSIKALDESFFRVRFERSTPSEKRYMRALAGLGRPAPLRRRCDGAWG